MPMQLERTQIYSVLVQKDGILKALYEAETGLDAGRLIVGDLGRIQEMNDARWFY